VGFGSTEKVLVTAIDCAPIGALPLARLWRSFFEQAGVGLNDIMRGFQPMPPGGIATDHEKTVIAHVEDE
jgi:hypothetical protein